MKLLNIAELEALDEKQLRILRARARDAVMHEVCNNQQIRGILEPLVRSLYNQLTVRGSSPPGGGGPPSP